MLSVFLDGGWAAAALGLGRPGGRVRIGGEGGSRA
jgi:hypothetical protein